MGLDAVKTSPCRNICQKWSNKIYLGEVNKMKVLEYVKLSAWI